MSGSKHKSCGDVAGAAKCQTITVETKVKIIESGAHSYNMNHSTISMILKNEGRIKEHVKAGDVDNSIKEAWKSDAGDGETPQSDRSQNKILCV